MLHPDTSDSLQHHDPGRILLIGGSVIGEPSTASELTHAGFRICHLPTVEDALQSLPREPQQLVVLRIHGQTGEPLRLRKGLERLKLPWSNIPFVGLGPAHGPIPDGLMAYLDPDRMACLPSLLSLLIRDAHTHSLDAEVLDTLEDGMDPATLEDILAMFIDDSWARLERLHEAHLNGDLEQMLREAHILKSAIATFGLVAAITPAKLLYEACQRRERDSIGCSLVLIDALLPPALMALRQRYRMDP